MNRIEYLKQVCANDPGDYMAQFELEELLFSVQLLKAFTEFGGQVPPIGLDLA